MQSVLRRLAPLFGALALCLSLAGVASADLYTALGDSYSSGTGTGSYTLNSSCQRSVYAYPYLVSQQRANTTLSFLACSGAKTTDVNSSQIPSLSSTTNWITMTIGGNDVGFGNLVLSCTLGDCTSQIASTNSQITNNLPGLLDTTYGQIKAKASSARVIILGYARAFGNTLCSAATGISSSEATQLNGVADNLDAVIKSRATAAGFTYQDATTPFTGHDVCSSTAWLNGYKLFTPSESYHPNKAGHSSGYAPLVRAVMG
jgi:lysophospholipase L1-like esterase